MLGVFRRACLSHLLCLFGHPEEAEAKSNESIARACEFAHPFTLGIALDYAAMLSVYQGESDVALARANEASEICGKYGFVYYLAVANILAGWATCRKRGGTTAGLTRLRQGLDVLKMIRAELRLPFYHGLLAEACGWAGQTGDALANIASGLAFFSRLSKRAGTELNGFMEILMLRKGICRQSPG